MQVTSSKRQYLPTTNLIFLGVLVWVFMASDAIAWYPATYAESAHGDPTSGVNRSGTPEDELRYHIGSCAHCHDTFDESISGVNELMLFAPMNPISQTDNFCFECHCDPGNSEQYEMIDNNDYGSTFGGGNPNSANIKDAFNLGPPNQALDGTTGSSHNLQIVRVIAKNRTDWVTLDTNACVVCHDPHLSQKNHNPYPTPPIYKTAIRLPDARSSDVNRPGNLWGDETGSDAGNEIVSEVPGLYQAPVYYPWAEAKSLYEPANDGTAGGSNLPNFVHFCTKCHGGSVPEDRHDAYLDPNRALYAINWSNAGDAHGKGVSPGFPTGDEGELKWPYTIQGEGANHALVCIDCHEPHGSPNPWLLRTCVNGKEGITVSISVWANDWRGLALYEFCTACHLVYAKQTDPPSPKYHSSFFDSQLPTADCGQCHYHNHFF